MAYRFNIAEPVPDNVRRIASEEIKTAISHLRKSGGEDREKDIHEARKAIKRLRALLRLVRPELGRWFAQENRALRDIGRSLSDLRDASIVIETLDSLSNRPQTSQKLRPVRDGLQRQKQAKDETTDKQQILHAAAGHLQEVGERVPQWTLRSDGFEALAEGLRKEYRAGRNAMKKALAANDSGLFHEWRKRAKTLLFHVRLLENATLQDLAHQEKKLHDLESALGDDHNLLILRQHLDSHPKTLGGKKVVGHSLQLVGERETELRAKAEALGTDVYKHRPKEFVNLLRAEWDRVSLPQPPRRKRRRTQP